MKAYNNILLLSMLLVGSSYGLEHIIAPPKVSYRTTETGVASGYEKLIQVLEKDLISIDGDLQHVKIELEKIAAEKTIAKGKLSQARTERARVIAQKNLSSINQDYQILSDLEQVYQQRKADVEQHLKLLRDYAADQEFKHIRFQGKATPNFDEVQEMGRAVANNRQLISDLEKRKTIYSEDLAKRKKALESINTELQEKIEQRDKIKDETTYEAELRQSRYKRDLAESKVKEVESRLELLDTQYKLARQQTSILKEEYARLKRILTVDTTYVKQAELGLEKKRQLVVDEQSQTHETIKLLSSSKDEIKQKIEDARERFGLTAAEISNLRDWNKSPKTFVEWQEVTEIGAFATRDDLIATEREYNEALIEFKKAKLRQDEIAVSIIRSWHRLTQRKFKSGSGEAIEQDIKGYGTPKAELQADLAAVTEKRNVAINMLHSLTTTLDKIKILKNDLKNQRLLLFKETQKDYNTALQLLDQSEEQVRKRIDFTAKLIETYSTTIATISQTVKKIEDVVNELGSKGWWQQQSVQAIEWSELKNVIPDLRQFFIGVGQSIIDHFSWSYLKKIGSSLYDVISHSQTLFHLLLQIVICILLYYILKLYIPDFRRHLLMISPEYGVFSMGSYFIATLLGFVNEWLFGIYLWACLFIAIKSEMISDPFIATIFYLLSVPYILYLTQSFMFYFAHINKQRSYAFISPTYQQRFLLVVSPLLAATVIIFFVREAFLQGNYPTSQVPVILLALNFILLQVALLCLISKEQIVSLIPTRTPLWEWIADHVNKYYYIILVGVIAVIIMSNPYVGYGHQVIYILSRLFLTCLLIPLFSWLHNRVKRSSSDLFFYYTDGENIKERFTAAKTWYGVFVVLTFLLFIFIGIMIGSAIWGHVIGAREMSQWLHYELYSPGFNEVTGKKIEITALSLLQILGYVIGGIVVTYIINYFLLRRIFDPLLVGSGVQNTILTLTRYIIIIIAVLIGLQSAGLDTMATKLAVIIGIIGFAIKEPIGDFFSYFIILVQRPISIGDLIMLDTDIMGVVRQITPRSTILRRRNSVTIIVPNSHIVTKPITNWNYTRTFFSFDDMLITVPYDADPLFVKQLILKVLDENPNILKNPAPIVWLHDFVDNGYQFLVRGYLTADKTLNQWDIASEVRLEMVRKLRKEGLEIATPTRTVRMLPKSERLEV